MSFFSCESFNKKRLVQLGIRDNNINIIYNGADLKKYYPVNKEKESYNMDWSSSKI